MVKKVLIINALVYLLLGIPFVFFQQQFSASMGTLPALGEVFMRALGSVFIGLSIISWYARNATKSSILTGVLLGNLVAHFLQAAGDSYAMKTGLMNSGGVTSVVIHVVLGLAFLYVLLFSKNTPKMKQKSRR